MDDRETLALRETYAVAYLGKPLGSASFRETLALRGGSICEAIYKNILIST